MKRLPLFGGGTQLVVIKLGGSLAETGRLRDCLRQVAGSRRPVVIVPGGGPFADAVREVQKREGFSDREAHFLAIRAMHDMAARFLVLQPGLVRVETLAAIRAAWGRGHIPVWLPLKLSLRDDTIPQDWTVTSDGLAARLAERLGRAPVVLVKSVRVLRSASAVSLAAAGVVDPTFAAITRRSGIRWRVMVSAPHELTQFQRDRIYRRRAERMVRPIPWQKTTSRLPAGAGHSPARATSSRRRWR